MRRLLAISLFLLSLLPISHVNANTEKLYERLVNDWSIIFPDGNRNAAGPRFFKYILDQNLEYEEFMQFNMLYCAVSGSLILLILNQMKFFLLI